MELREDDPGAQRAFLDEGDVNSLVSKRQYLQSLEGERDEVRRMYDMNELGHGEFARMMSDLDQLIYSAQNAIMDSERLQRGDTLSIRRKIGHFFFGR